MFEFRHSINFLPMCTDPTTSCGLPVRILGYSIPPPDIPHRHCAGVIVLEQQIAAVVRIPDDRRIQPAVTDNRFLNPTPRPVISKHDLQSIVINPDELIFGGNTNMSRVIGDLIPPPYLPPGRVIAILQTVILKQPSHNLLWEKRE